MLANRLNSCVNKKDTQSRFSHHSQLAYILGLFIDGALQKQALLPLLIQSDKVRQWFSGITSDDFRNKPEQTRDSTHDFSLISMKQRNVYKNKRKRATRSRAWLWYSVAFPHSAVSLQLEYWARALQFRLSFVRKRISELPSRIFEMSALSKWMLFSRERRNTR